MNLLWKKTYILSTAILRPHRHLYWNSIVYTIHDKNSDFLDDNGEGKNKFHKFIYLVNKLHGECSERENEFAPKMCIYTTVIKCCEFFWWITNKKIQSSLFKKILPNYLVKKLWVKMFPQSGVCAKTQNEFAPKNVHLRYSDQCCEFFWWITNKKIQSPLFSTVAATVLNGFCKFLFSLTDI